MVVVFGSINLDLVTRIARFPAPGETLAADSFATYPGGKGANQALAAARAGSTVRLFGAVGRDAFADPALELLRAGGVDLGGVARVSERTGCATILVDAHGENCIVVAAGANVRADPASVPDAALTSATILVLQHEVADGAAGSWPAGAAAFARSAGTVSSRLTIAVTLGSKGALISSDGALLSATPPRLDVVDTTGAGDAFVGALVAALGRGASMRDALGCAVAAGTLACTIAGAQPSLPDRAAIDAWLPFVTSSAT